MVQFAETKLKPLFNEAPTSDADAPDFEFFLTQKDESQKCVKGYFHLFYTTSVKKPYKWEHWDYYNNVAPVEYDATYEEAKNKILNTKKDMDWAGVKLVAFEVDCLNPTTSYKYLSNYSFNYIEPKKKTYINGVKANNEFIAKKGKMFYTKATP